MADRLAGARERLEKAKFWKVVGGASSGGLIVKESSKLSSKELNERLSTGALVSETELQGERLKYKLVNGTGPASGWVSTKFKGNALLVKHTLRIAIMCAGSRGDMQPLLALGLGLKRTGFRVSMWTHENYCKFVESYGLPCFGFLDAFGQNNMFPETEKQTTEQEELEKEQTHASLTFWARYALSMCYDSKVAGVSWEDPVPELEGEFVPDGADIMGRLAVMAFGMGKHLHVAKISKAREEMLAKRFPEGSTADADARASTSADPGHAEVLKDAKDAWEEDVERYRNFQLGMDGVEQLSLGLKRFGCTDPTRPQRFLKAYEEEEPDLVLWHWALLPALAMNLELKFGTPGIPFQLSPPVDLADPTAPMMTAQWWHERVLTLMPHLQELGSFWEARAKWTPPKEATVADPFIYSFIVKLEEALLEPLFGCAAVRSMGPELYQRRSSEGVLIAYLSSLASTRVLSQLGEQTRMTVAKQILTGFWIMDDEDQASAEMFGASKAHEQVKEFLAAGAKPAYIGWGSLFTWKGKEWMCMLAVAALKEAGMRGIVLGGWAGLNMELLQEMLGEEDELGLCAYAKQNVIFVAAISQTWLFPQCAVLVIHGGSGTTAAAWSSGVPTVVVPVLFDQPQNGLINEFVGAGFCTKNLSDISPPELAGALKWAATSPDALRGAQGVQLSMMRDRPVEKTTERILEFLTEDIPSGKWRSIKAEMELRRRMAGEVFDRFDEDGDGWWDWVEYSKFFRVVRSDEPLPQHFEAVIRLTLRPGAEATPERFKKGLAREGVLDWYTDVRLSLKGGAYATLYSDYEVCCHVAPGTP